MCGCGGGSAAAVGTTLLSGTLDARYSSPPSDSGAESLSSDTGVVDSPVPGAPGKSELIEVGLLLAFLVALAWVTDHTLRRGKGD